MYIPHYIAIVQTILNGMGNPKLDSFIFQVHKVQTVHFNKKRAKKFQLERIMAIKKYERDAFRYNQLVAVGSTTWNHQDGFS